MRHIQLYESFGTEEHSVTAYTDYEDWMEFMKSSLSDDYFRRFNNIDYERMWRDRTAYQSPTYVVDNGYNKWIFWLDPPKYQMQNPKEIAALVISHVGAIHDSNQNTMETTLKCSYKDLIAQAKSPEEIMLAEIGENSSLAATYSESRPRVFKKMLELPNIPSNINDIIKASLKWRSIQNYI
jgi:hypothetical protein